MSAITESLNLDVTRRSNIKVIHIKQGDTNSRRITTPILVDGTQQTIVGSSNTALINIRRPDAQQKSFAATINSDNTVTAVIPNFAAEIASTPTRMTVASISIMEGTTVKYETEDFFIDVGKTNEGARGADSDADILMELIAYTNEAVDRVNSIIDTTTEHMERAEAAAETAEHIADIVDVHKDGYYPSMTVGTSEQLIGEATTSDNSPYLLRKSAGSGLETNKLIGGTVAWNQLLPSTTSAKWEAQVGTLESTENSIKLTTTKAEQSQAIRIATANGGVPIVKGHKCLLLFGVLLSEATSKFKVYVMYNQSLSFPAISADIKTECAKIFESTEETGGNSFFGFYPKYAGTGLAVGATLTVYNPVLFDLTQMFGSTIADYIYSLEQATAGAGVAWFKQHFPKDYYAYDAGSLISVKPTAHKMVGFNQWDEVWELGGINSSDGQNYSSATTIRSKNYISIVPDTAYFCKNSIAVYPRFYDANKTYISNGGYGSLLNQSFTSPSNARYMRFALSSTTYNHDICINFSDPAKNGTYEPYEVHEYSLGSDELRGIPQLTDGKLSYSGDVKTADGQITRKYGIITLDGSNDETMQINGYRVIVNIPENSATWTNQGVTAHKVISDRFVETTNEATYHGAVGFHLRSTGDHQLIFSLGENGPTTTANWRAWFSQNPTTVVYELATQTTEQGTAYSPYQRVSADGTEEFVDERDVPVPVGHETQYYDVYSKDEITELKRIALASFATDTASGAIATFPDGADDIPVKSATFAIEPQQDLNGYDSPWPAGGGKNKLSLTVAGIKSANSNRTWNGNATTFNGITYTILTNDSDAVIGIQANGTATAIAALNLWVPTVSAFKAIFGDNTSVILNGSVAGGSSTTYFARVTQLSPYFILTTVTGTEDGSFNTSEVLDSAKNVRVLINVDDGTTVNNIVFKPMLRLSTVSDATFEPYSNICPISGWTGAKITKAGKNVIPYYNLNRSGTTNGVTYTWNDDQSLTFSGTATNNAFVYFNQYSANHLTGYSLPSGSYYISTGISGASAAGYRCQVSIYKDGVYKRDVKDVGSGANFSINEGELAEVYIYIPNEKVMDGITLYPMIEVGSTGTAYEPWIANATKTITWSEAGTVYGGTLEYLGGERWRLTRTMAVDTSFALNEISTVQTVGDYTRFWLYTSGKTNGPVICNILPTAAGSSSYSTQRAEIYGADPSYPQSYWAKIPTSLCGTTAASIKDYVDSVGMEVVYPLATPQTYDLTADELRTLLGTNNIWSDTGDAEVTYRADTALYINKLLNP